MILINAVLRKHDDDSEYMDPETPIEGGFRFIEYKDGKYYLYEDGDVLPWETTQEP